MPALDPLNIILTNTTIVAIATAQGTGGVGIIRLSGQHCAAIATRFLGHAPTPRHAYYCHFHDAEDEVIDQGLLIYFKAPHSFTGEDILELQGHGGMIVLQRLLQRCLALGATMARAGEFSERAFANGKMDLIQAEAMHDLINSHSEAQAKAAMRSLNGAFSTHIHALLNTLIQLRVYVESCIDFSDEDIDFITQGDVLSRTQQLHHDITLLLSQANQGQILRDGIHVVLAGRPNAGKSSLLNALSGSDTAIVTDIAGTTRDLLKTQIVLDGLPLHIIDTAGLRDTDNIVEAEGIRRARQAMTQADLVLWLHDDREHAPHQDIIALSLDHLPLLMIFNKIDLTTTKAGQISTEQQEAIAISVTKGWGLTELKTAIKKRVGFTPQESIFSARTRHIDALNMVLIHLTNAQNLISMQSGIELIAEELRLAQRALAEITGAFTTDMLLGEIFSHFCIGK